MKNHRAPHNWILLKGEIEGGIVGKFFYTRQHDIQARDTRNSRGTDSSGPRLKSRDSLPLAQRREHVLPFRDSCTCEWSPGTGDGKACRYFGLGPFHQGWRNSRQKCKQPFDISRIFSSVQFFFHWRTRRRERRRFEKISKTPIFDQSCFFLFFFKAKHFPLFITRRKTIVRLERVKFEGKRKVDY